MDIILRAVKRYGWLPLIEKDGKEIYRGEFHSQPLYALDAAEEWLDGQEATNNTEEKGACSTSAAMAQITGKSISTEAFWQYLRVLRGEGQRSKRPRGET